mmetsp:Transcript_35327/g.53107  ORF Transcript_35327/g.53107 Transcript_35327/m.53107 type:complete len:267 (-) Transcript_35327:54-854(-)
MAGQADVPPTEEGGTIGLIDEKPLAAVLSKGFESRYCRSAGGFAGQDYLVRRHPNGLLVLSLAKSHLLASGESASGAASAAAAADAAVGAAGVAAGTDGAGAADSAAAPIVAASAPVETVAATATAAPTARKRRIESLAWRESVANEEAHGKRCKGGANLSAKTTLAEVKMALGGDQLAAFPSSVPLLAAVADVRLVELNSRLESEPHLLVDAPEDEGFVAIFQPRRINDLSKCWDVLLTEKEFEQKANLTCGSVRGPAWAGNIDL